MTRQHSTTGLLSSVLAGLLMTALFPLRLEAQGEPSQERFDIVLQGGRVMDPESGLDAIRNVGINGPVVAAISEEMLRGDRVVDVSGLVVAPGFIDLHAHGQSVRANEFQARDGVTTALELESGVPSISNFTTARQGRSILHFGASVSHMAARVFAVPETKEDAQRAAGPAEIERIASFARYDRVPSTGYGELRRALQAELDQGALGIGMAHQYYPGADRAEIFEVFGFAAAARAPIFTHVRSMGADAIQEVVANAAATGASLHVVHLNSSSLWEIPMTLDLIEGAQASGHDITTEAYPYTAASTGLGSAIFDDGWRKNLRIDYGDLQWQDTGERLTEESFRSYRDAGGTVIIHMMQPEWIRRALSRPFVMVASDGMPYAPGAHPRSAGTFSRFLGRYVRDEGLMTLMEGLERITIMPARRLEVIAPAMRRKGRLRPGADADIVVFDAERIIDTATFEEDLSFSQGVIHLLVHGVFVVSDGANVAGVLPGQAILGSGA